MDRLCLGLATGCFVAPSHLRVVYGTKQCVRVQSYLHRVGRLKVRGVCPLHGSLVTHSTLVHVRRLLGGLKGAILEQTAVKYARPAGEELLVGVSDEERARNDFQYRRVTTYNYAPEELSLLVDAVGMLKSLSSLLLV